MSSKTPTIHTDAKIQVARPDSLPSFLQAVVSLSASTSSQLLGTRAVVSDGAIAVSDSLLTSAESDPPAAPVSDSVQGGALVKAYKKEHTHSTR